MLKNGKIVKSGRLGVRKSERKSGYHVKELLHNINRVRNERKNFVIASEERARQPRTLQSGLA